MSSFESFDVLLVNTAAGRERLLWRSANDGQIRETFLERGEMEDVSRRFCDEFEKTYLRKTGQNE